MKPFIVCVLTAFLLAACSKDKGKAADYDPAIAIAAVQILSSDDFKGREAGRESGRRSADEIVRLIGNYSKFEPEQMDFTFSPKRENENRMGRNIILTIPGQKKDGPVLVVTAHYDHLGEVGPEIFNGADDNASGIGGLFALMQSFERKKPKNTVVLAWLDAEEFELAGAKAFLKNYKPLKGRSMVNLNLDMIARSQKGELYMAGGYHTPALIPLVKKAAKNSPVILKLGHDTPQDGNNDWTTQSDHSVFHTAGVPFVYLGVEDHEHYHKSTDSFETLPIAFYENVLDLVVRIARNLDSNLKTLAKPAKA